MDFKTKSVTRYRGGYHIIIKRTTQLEDITTVNIYAPNMGAPKYIRKLLININEIINSKTIIVEDFNIPLTSMDRLSKHKI